MPLRSLPTLAGVVSACTLAGLLLAPAASGLERCRASVSKKDGTIFVNAAGASGPVSWGDSAETASRPFANADVCEAAGKLKRCALGEPGTEARIVPPRLCSLHLTDGEGTCTAYVRGCTPGARDELPDKRVFVTNGSLPGSFNGLAGADGYCNLAAETGGLSGTFRAWLSDTTQFPSNRFLRSRGPYVRLDGARVADDWLDLVDGELQNPIDLTETLQPSSATVWTNTIEPGSPRSNAPGFGHCDEWTSDEPGDVGYVGQAGASDGGWTSVDPTQSCATPHAFYCVEQ